VCSRARGREVAGERRDDEGAGEGGDPDPKRGLEPPAHVGGVDLHPGQEREHNRGERSDEIELLLTVKFEDVACDGAQGELEQRDGDAELDQEHARDEHDCCKNGGE